MKRMNTTAVWEGLSDVLNQVAYAEERLVLNRRGKDVAALVSMEDLLLLQVLEDKLDNEAGVSIPWEQVKKEVGLPERPTGSNYVRPPGERLRSHVQYDLSQVRRSAKETRSKPLYDSASPQP